MAITVEEVVNMTIQLTMRASQAEAKVKQLEEQIKEMEKESPKLKEVK